MEYLVAVSSADSRLIQEHFGRTEEFEILKVEDNQRYCVLERRAVTAPCNAGEHDGHRLAQVIEALSDCRYVLSAKIGIGAQRALRARGVTPLEITHLVDYAMGKVMLYDKRIHHKT